MVYGLTIPRQARSSRLGARFLAFVLSSEGRRIMEQNGQPSLDPPEADHPECLPEILKPFFKIP